MPSRWLERRLRRQRRDAGNYLPTVHLPASDYEGVGTADVCFGNCEVDGRERPLASRQIDF